MRACPLQLDYQDGSYPQYNGNIANQRWGSSLGNVFTYQYDKLNRLTNGTSTGVSMGEVITYDVMGNITSMNRDNTGAKPYTYRYSNNSNQLDYVDGLTSTSYVYDPNGNATTDGRNGMGLTYNHLNLPITANGNGVSLAYTYDANGQKLRKVSSTMGTTDYVGGIQYTNGTIDFIQTEEGRAVNQSGTYKYEYNLTDHLGNVRYSFDIYGGVVRRLQGDDYYAFGLRHSVSPVVLDNNCLYNGKELQDELGQYDYGARFYDPVIGRWNVVDPSSEQGGQESLTQYQYGMNNPVRYTDPDGKCPTCPIFWAMELYEAAKYKVTSVLGFKTYADGARDLIAAKVQSQDQQYKDNVPEKVREVNDKGAVIKAYTKVIQGGAEIMGNASEAMGLAMGGVQGTMSAAAEKVAAEKVSVYRVFGGDAKAEGFSWTPIDPSTVKNYRSAAGLPSGGASGATNTAEFMVEGIVKPSNIIKTRAATSVDGHPGGLLEYLINPKNVKEKTYSTFNPFK